MTMQKKNTTDITVQENETLLTTQPTVSAGDLPSSFSWLEYGGNWMTPAKYEGFCDSSFIFSAIGVFEAAINIAYGYDSFDRDLSEQYVLSCLPAAGSCDGGWASEVIFYIESEIPASGNGINGCPLETCMPYQAKDYIPCDSKCADWDTFSVPPREDDILWQVKDFGVTSGPEDDPNYWNLLKSWIFTYGPIAADIYASNGFINYFSSHHSAYDVYEIDDLGISNHFVVICGWVDDPAIMNGGYWILKDSLGMDWGYNGFANIAYGCNSLGTRDVAWVTAMEWDPDDVGPGPGPYDMKVYADFEYSPEIPSVGEEIQFTDKSEGKVTMWEWDFESDGIIDSHVKNPSHTYEYGGKYDVSLTVTSEWGLSSRIIRPVEVIGENLPPSAPQISGESKVFVEKESTFTFTSNDNNGGDKISYYIDWGDGNTEDWFGLHDSNEIVTKTHVYEKGTYKLTAKSRDQLELESEESTFEVKASKSKTQIRQAYLWKTLEGFPLIKQLLSMLLL